MASAAMVREPPGGPAIGAGGPSPRRTGSPKVPKIPLDWRTATTLIGVSLPVVVGFSVAPAGAVTGYLPQAAYDLLLSFTRMVLAYGLSLGFSLGYGYLSAANRPAERLMIPTLDILQSVPIIGFFPVVLLVFVNILPGSWVGPNLASIFLIFTSMSWNMVFGVYESLKSIPSDLREASDSFGVSGPLRLRKLLLPATANRLVYNSVLSWTGGWYFLVVAEFFATSDSTVKLPGIGSFLLGAAGSGNAAALVAGLILLVTLIACLDIFLWRPLGKWAEKYRYDQTPSGEADLTPQSTRLRGAPLRRAAGYVYHGVRTGISRAATPLAGFAAYAVPARVRPPPEASRRVLRWAALGTTLVLLWLMLITLGVGVFDVFTGPIPAGVRAQILTLPVALATSFGRLIVAYLICLSITLPLGIYLIRRPKVYRVGLPVIEIVASVPATALFPLFVFALLPYLGLEGVSVLMLLTGMLWYLFFNLLSGLRAIPPDLEEAARSYGLSRWVYYKRLVLPAIFPAFVTGSITAFGGGWNTLIIAEYLQAGSLSFHVPVGIGELIDIGNAEHGGAALLAASILTMVVAVVAVNEVLWKPLYRRAVERYRYD
jgi:NitT/TauT family transport system permease protein